MQKWPDKDPDEVLDYIMDWSPRNIQGDTIQTIQATVTSGDVQVATNSISGLQTRTWLSGGTNGTPCVVGLRITTAAGRVLDESVQIRIRTR